MFTTRGELRDLLRERIYDEPGVSYSDAKLNRQLNRSAQRVGDYLAEHSRICYSRGSIQFSVGGGEPSTDNTGIVVELPSVPDFQRAIGVVGGDGFRGLDVVDETDFPRLYAKFTGGLNQDGRYIAAITYNPMAGGFSGGFSSAFQRGTGLQVKFLFSAAAETTFTLVYARTITAIPSGANYDDWTYRQIPGQWQEGIVEHAAAVLLAHEGVPTAGAAAGFLGAITGMMVNDVRERGSAPSTM